MEPFSIACTTCQAKLRVRDASAIGQILTCPKCGSMVLIEAPAVTPAQPGAKDAAATTVADRPIKRPPPRPANPANKRATEFSDTVEDLTKYGTLQKPAVGTESAEAPAVASNESEVGSANESDNAIVPSSSFEELPDASWESDAARQRRRWFLVGGAMFAGIGLAVGVFLFLAGRSGHRVADTNTLTPPAPAATRQEDAAEPIAIPVPTPEPLPPNSPINPSAEVTTSAPAVPAKDPAEELPNSGPKSAPPVPAPDVHKDTSAPLLPEPAVTETAKSAVQNVGVPAAPPDLNREDVDRKKADRMTPGGSLSETLRKLGGLFDDSGEKPESEPPPAEMPLAGPADAGTPAPAAEPARLPRPAPRVVDVTARLADPIKQIEFTDTPLQEFLQFVTTYSTIPVILDPDVLVWLKLTPNTPVTLRMSDTTVAMLLDGVLSKMGLVAIPLENFLYVTRKPVGDGALRKTRRQVKDLIGGDAAQADQLVAQIVALIAPESWAGGNGTVRIAEGWLELEQVDSVLLEVGSLLERLRVARGLPKLSGFDEKLFQPITRTVRAAPQLEKSITLNFSRPTALTRIIRRLSQESGLAILVDWQAVAKAEWNPDAEVTLTVTAKPVSETLVALLQPMELVYRIVDESTVQITTPADLDARLDLEFYPVADLLGESQDVDALMRKIQATIPADWFTGASSSGVWRFDAPSRCLLILLSQPRQQAFEAALQNMRK